MKQIIVQVTISEEVNISIRTLNGHIDMHVNKLNISLFSAQVFKFISHFYDLIISFLSTLKPTTVPTLSPDLETLCQKMEYICQTCVPHVLCFPSSHAHIWFSCH